MISYYLVGVAVMAIITYIIRILPITLFQKEITSQFVQSFLYYVPYAVLASLTFPAIFTATGNTLTSVAGTVVALVLAYFNKGLIVVAVGAVVTALFLGIFF